MNIIEVYDRTSDVINHLLEIWEDSVKATHLFLSPAEIQNIKKYVPQAIKEVSHLLVMENEKNEVIAFMGINDKKLEMLFVQNSERGKGLGKQLLSYGIETYHVNELVVNEQNPKAKSFYESMGFQTYKRAEFDEQGNPYPVFFMRLD